MMNDVKFSGKNDGNPVEEILQHDEGDKLYPESEQSANTLFHFVGKIEYLFDILEKCCLYPRYCAERYSFLPSDFPPLIFPMKCFCNIYLEKLQLHCKEYGSYGIGFKRDALLRRGVQPVQYINEASDLGKILKKDAQNFLNKGGDILANNFLHSKLFNHLKHSKPLSGKDKDGKMKFLPDEKEWRFVPTVNKKNKSAAFLNVLANPDAIRRASDEIEKREELKLDYEYSDIKYLIVNNAEERMCLAKYIWYRLKLEGYKREQKENVKLELISKIVELDRIRGDL